MAKRMFAPASHSADARRADGLTSCSSADSHRAARVSPDTMVALLSYNVGIQNTEVAGKHWGRANGKYNKPKNDVQALTQQHGYGKLPGDTGILLPTRFTDTVALAK